MTVGPVEPGKRRQKRRVNIENPLRKRRNEIWRKQTHVAGEANQIHFCFVQRGDHEAVVGFAFQPLRRNHARGEATRFGAVDSGGGFAIAQDQRDFRVGNSSRHDGIGEGFEVRAAAAQEHAYALGHKQKTLAQVLHGPKLR